MVHQPLHPTYALFGIIRCAGDMTMRMNRLCNYATNLALAVLSSVVVFGVAELAVKTFAPQLSWNTQGLYQFNQVLEAWVLTPNSVAMEFKPDFGEVEVRTNGCGLRDHREYSSKRDGVFRILALGDSFTYGFGLKYEDTYLRHLEKLLNNFQSPEQIEIIKAGVPGFQTPHELNYLKHYGLLLNPDMVLLGFIGEDMMYRDLSLRASPHHKSVIWSLFSARSVGQLEIRMRRSSHLYNLVSSFSTSQRAFLRWLVEKKANDSFVLRSYPPKWQKRWNETEGYLNEMYTVLSASDIPLVIVVIPLRIQILLHQFKIDNNRFDIEKPAKLIKGFGATYGVPVLDVLPRFLESAREGDLYFPVDGHPNPTGARILAVELDAFLRQVPRMKDYYVRSRRSPTAK
jgi:lysophospholipase L1-like esterase